MTRSKLYLTVFHLVCWTLVSLPFVTFSPQNVPQDNVTYAIRFCFPVLLAVMFYMNYLWLVPHYFISGNAAPPHANGTFGRWLTPRAVFFGINIVAVVALSVAMQQLMDVLHVREMALEGGEQLPGPPYGGPGPIDGGPGPIDGAPGPIDGALDGAYGWSFLLVVIGRHTFPLALSAAIAVLLRLAMRWQQAEAARKEMEIQKTEAELSNLRSQINPHVLLTTLNNIYALIAYDQAKAQRAMLSLSALLRQMLYGSNQDREVSLRDAAEYITNYIALMRLRMGRNVAISVNIDIPPRGDISVAPFNFISLVETSFTNGVSTT